MSADEAGDALLFAVESLRSALPPELPPSALIAPPSPNDPKFSRERALAALTSLARAAHACSSSTRLHIRDRQGEASVTDADTEQSEGGKDETAQDGGNSGQPTCWG